MRRKDRLMPPDFALSVIDKCTWAVLSMISKEGTAYGVPLSIVRDESTLYFHCAKVGKKIDCLRENPYVSLSCIGDTRLRPEYFTTEFESAIISGTAQEVIEDAEKIYALRLICKKYAASNMCAFDDAIEKSLAITAIWKISIGDISGKRKKYGDDGKELKFGV